MPITELSLLLRTLAPTLHEGLYAFSSWTSKSAPPSDAIATFQESEGMTVILPLAVATRLGLAVHFRAAWIELRVNSDLTAVGLTAAVATALADTGISCNVVAAVHHDHLFVPIDDAERAISVLNALQAAHSV